MGNKSTVVAAGSVDFAAIREREERIMRAGHSPSTQRTYAHSWLQFGRWCEATGLDQMPATTRTVQDYATWMLNETYRLITVRLHMSAIKHYHEQAGRVSPVDASVCSYLMRAKRELKEQSQAKAALTYDMLKRIAEAMGDSPIEIRNRAMLLLCFAAGWRRSEIVALRFSDIRLTHRGIELKQRSSKTDQTGQGRTVGIAKGKRQTTCPLLALKAWLAIRGKWEGPLFPRFTPGFEMTHKPMHERANMLHLLVKKAVKLIGEDPALFGAHSLRAGMITEAAKHGASEMAIKQRTGHKCSRTLQTYIRPAHIFDFNPLAKVL